MAGLPVSRSERFIVSDGSRDVTVERLADGRLSVDGHAQPFTVLASGDGSWLVSDGTSSWRVFAATQPDAVLVHVDGLVASVAVTSGAARVKPRAGQSGEAVAPMPGTVIEILVQPGQAVLAGETLLTLEAMKMEMPIRSHRAGTVAAIRCAAGELVQPGVVLVEVT